MEYVAVIDLSSFIWCEKDFKENTHTYYNLVQKIPSLYEKLDQYKCLVLLRQELFYEILQYFPYGKLPLGYKDFEEITFSFLGNLGHRMLTFPSQNDVSIVSTPNIIKEYYSNTTKIEVRYLITKIHSDRSTENVYFTFPNLWNKKNLLSTQKEAKEIEKYDYETIIVDDEKELDKFFLSRKRTFHHSLKHTKYKSGDYASPLSCYDESDDFTKPQKLLDEAYFSGKSYYNFDLENGVWVVFRHTEKNMYHGFDEKNAENIPPEIRSKLSK